MNKIEQMHLDAIKNCKNEVAFNVFGTMISTIDESLATTEASKITEQIAIEFAEWLWKNCDEEYMSQHSWENHFKEFLKTK